MNKEIQSPRRLPGALAGAALPVLAGLLCLSHLLGQGLANLSFDLPFRWRPNPKLEKSGVIIIYMDEPSAKEIHQPWVEAQWDRKFYAQLLTRLENCHARAVAFDILFDEPRTNDQLFVNAIKAAQETGTRVILGGKVDVTQMRNGSIQTSLSEPVPALKQEAAFGLAEWPIGDTPLRRHFSGAEGQPSLAMRAAELVLPRPPQPWPAERWINFYGPAATIPYRSFAQSLDFNLTSAETFSNKVCFVGAWPGTALAGGLRTDECSTPFSRWGFGKTPGVELTATVFLNLARGDWLRRLPVWGEAGVVILAGLLSGFGLALCRPKVAVLTGLGAAIAVVAVANWLMWQEHIWFSWLIIAGVQIPMAMAMAVLAWSSRLHREKALLQEALARQPIPCTAAAIAMVGDYTDVATADAPAPRAADWVPAIPDHTMLRCVGRGAYGEVWLARNAIGTYHAVKIVRRDAFERSEPFEREFRGLKKFMPISHSHPGLVHILHVGRRDAEGFIYYVMEAADDETKGPLIDPDTYSPRNLAKEIRTRGHLSAAECLQLGLDLTAALDFLHQQRLIHRDIKPANIIFVRGAPKFADIGLVTEIAGTSGVTYLGTKGYIAPEGPGTPGADLYSLGKVLYEASMGMGCGLFPELPATLVERPDHAELLQLNKVILKACRQDPTQRYQTAAEMREQLLLSKASK